MAVTIKTKKEIDVMREGGYRLAEILRKVKQATVPGISTLELDRLAESLIFESGGVPAFKDYQPEGARTPYPCTMCISLNEEVVHAIPRSDRIIKEGDVVSLDIGMQWPASAKATAGKPAGLYTDMAITVGVGKISKDAERLIHATREALDIGIAGVRPGARLGDIGAVIQARLQRDNFGIVRDLAGHGIGHELHEEPFVLNYGKKGTGMMLREGMVIAIEPMATLGDWRVKLQKDGWTFITADRSTAAHFEHTIAVTADGGAVLTAGT